MEMLGEQKQDGVALLLDPAGRRSLISPFRISRKCRMCVAASAPGDERVALCGHCVAWASPALASARVSSRSSATTFNVLAEHYDRATRLSSLWRREPWRRAAAQRPNAARLSPHRR
jgi:hypothetical protein